MLEPDTGWCANEDVELRSGVDIERCVSENARP